MRFGQPLGGCRLAVLVASLPTLLLLPHRAPAGAQALLASGRSPGRLLSGTARATAFSTFAPHSSTMSPAAGSADEGGESVAADATATPEDPLVRMGLPSPLILGSGSFTRKLILKEMGINYQLVVRPIDEKGLGDRDGDPSDLVTTLALAKGEHLVSRLRDGDDDDESGENKGALPREKVSEGDHGGWVVLTADQVVTHDGSVLEKPESIAEARQFVEGYASSPPATVGACVLTHVPTGLRVSGVDTATIRFRPSVAEGDLVGRLVEDGAPVLNCAGGLMVEHPLVKEHIEGIDGTEDSVMGLSKELVLRLLAELRDKLRSSQ